MIKINKPLKPAKYINIEKTVYAPYPSMMYGDFLIWVQEQLPKNAIAVSISADYDYVDYNEYCPETKLELSWYQKAVNPKYEKQMERYQIQLEKWKNQKK